MSKKRIKHPLEEYSEWKMSLNKIFKIRAQKIWGRKPKNTKASAGEELGACSSYVINSQLEREREMKRKVQRSYIFSTFHTLRDMSKFILKTMYIYEADF